MTAQVSRILRTLSIKRVLRDDELPLHRIRLADLAPLIGSEWVSVSIVETLDGDPLGANYELTPRGVHWALVAFDLEARQQPEEPPS